MKPKTIDLLLDYYIKERIPNSKDILDEATKDESVLKERSHTFSFAPTLPQDASPLHKERSHTFSFAPAPPDPHHQRIAESFSDGEQIPTEIFCWRVDGVFQPDFSASADVTDGLDNEERQRCKAVAKKLVKIADEFQENRMSSLHEESCKYFSDESEKDYTPEEWNTLERIYSDGTSQGVSSIASVLASCFTRQTLQAVVRFLSGQNGDVSQQLAIALELSTHVVRLMGGRVLGTIRNVVTETFQHHTELEDL